jgi:uncharacterized coiled-coil DUF342 family protein
MPSRNELVQSLNALEQEISALKQGLALLSRERRGLLEERSAIRNTFFPVIEKVKESRMHRDEETGSVKALKTARDKASSEVKRLAAVLSDHQKAREKKAKELGVQRNAQALKREIEALEYKQETSALAFDKEQKLTKLLKEKKASLAKAKQLDELADKMREAMQVLDSARTVSAKAHHELTRHASASQKMHEEMVSGSKQARELREKLKPMDAKLANISKKYDESQHLLVKKLAEAEALRSQLGILEAASADEQKKQKQQHRAEKEQELTSRMKSGKKLTTMDLLALRET